MNLHQGDSLHPRRKNLPSKANFFKTFKILSILTIPSILPSQLLMPPPLPPPPTKTMIQNLNRKSKVWFQNFYLFILRAENRVLETIKSISTNLNELSSASSKSFSKISSLLEKQNEMLKESNRLNMERLKIEQDRFELEKQRFQNLNSS